MSEIFQNCEDNINKQARRLQELMNQSTQDSLEISSCLEEAKDNLKQMEIELESYDKHTREQLKQQYRLQRQKVEEIDKLYKSMQSKDALFNGAVPKRLLQDEKLYDQTQKLMDAKMVGYGMIQQSEEIQIGLHRNNEILSGDIDKVRNTRTELSESTALLKIMSDRIKNNKLVMYLVAVIVLIAVSAIFYLNY